MKIKYSKSTSHLFSDLKVDKDSREVHRVQTCHMEGRRVKEDMTYKEFLQKGSQYRTAFMGLTHARRDALVVDVDRNAEESMNSVIATCVDIGVQFPNVVVVNRKVNPNRDMNDQNHYQLIWFVDEPWRGVWNRWDGGDKDSFNWTTKTMARLLGGDPSFKGGYFKNPYCDFEQETIWLNESPLPRKQFEKYLRYKSHDDSWLNEVKSASRRGLERIDSGWECNSYSLLEQTILEHSTDSPSRNVIAHKYACRKGLSFMLCNNGVAPTVNMIKKWVVEAEKEVAKRYGIKEGIEPSENISSTARSVYLFIKSAYNPSYETGSNCTYTEEQMRRGWETRGIKSITNHLLAKAMEREGEITCARDLTEPLDVKLCTAREYLREPLGRSEEECRDILNDWFYRYIDACSYSHEVLKNKIVKVFGYYNWEFVPPVDID